MGEEQVSIKKGYGKNPYTPQIAAETRAKRVRKAIHGEDVKTAKEIALERQRKDKKLNEIAEAYFSSTKGRALKGQKTDINRYNRNLSQILGNRTISSLSQLDVERIKSKMPGKAAATIYNVLELLRRLINWGVKNGLCMPIPFKIQLTKRDNEVTEYLKPNEAKRLIQVLDSWPSQEVSRMLKLAMISGLRRGEIFKLEDRDVDLIQGLLEIRDPKGGTTVMFGR